MPAVAPKREEVLRDLRSLRLRRGLSQADLSAKSGVSEFTISEIEAGKRPNARPSTARKLAAGLGVDVADLYGEVMPSPKVAAPPSLEWALAAPDEEFDSWVETANLQDTLTLNYELSEATAREPFGSERHRFMWRRLDEVIGRFRKIGGPFTEPAASKKRRARRAQQDAEDAASEAG